MTRKRVWKTKTASETIDAGRQIGAFLRPGTVIALTGDLGSGKTTFVKGLAAGLGLKNPGRVKSPTFVIFHIYKARVPLYHFDLYRLNGDSEVREIGLEEFCADRSAVSVIEWADKSPLAIELAQMRIDLLNHGQNGRTIRIRIKK